MNLSQEPFLLPAERERDDPITVYMTNSTYVCGVRRVYWSVRAIWYTLTYLEAQADESLLSGECAR